MNRSRFRVFSLNFHCRSWPSYARKAPFGNEIFFADYEGTEKKSSKKRKMGLTKSRKYSIIKKRRGVNAPLGAEPQRRRCRGRKEDTSEDRRNSRRIDLRDSEA